MQLSPTERTGCEERAGFLFRHECANPARYRCDSCGKAVCVEHKREVDWPLLEAGGQIQPGARGQAAFGGLATVCVACAQRIAKGPRPQDSTGGSSGYSDYDDPYWYSTRHYHGYNHFGPGHWGHNRLGHSGHRHDPNDFTPADTASVRNEGDESFEMETGGS